MLRTKKIMALGDNGNFKKNNGGSSGVNVYSPYRFTNVEGVDPSKLQITFWSGMIVLSIAPIKNSNGDKIEFDYDNQISVYLTHTKAKMLSEEIRYLLSNYDSCNNVGVDSGSDGLVVFHNGKEFGVDHPVIAIYRINKDGVVTSSCAYEFNTSYHYSIRNFNNNNSQFDRYYHDNLEIEQLLMILDEFVKCKTFAQSYACLETFNKTGQLAKMDTLLNHFGLAENKPNYSNRSNGTSYFNNKSSSNANSSYNQSSLDNYMNQPEDDID